MQARNGLRRETKYRKVVDRWLGLQPEPTGYSGEERVYKWVRPTEECLGTKAPRYNP